MTDTNSTTTSIAPSCQFQFADGRNCRMLRDPAHPNFCAFHARQEFDQLESQRLGVEVSRSLHGDFLTATDINHVLGKLFIAVAQDRIPVRKALALTYMGQVMLTSLPHVKQEFPFEYKFEHWQKVVNNAAPLSQPPPPPALTDADPNSNSNSNSTSDSNSSADRFPALPDLASPDEE